MGRPQIHLIENMGREHHRRISLRTFLGQILKEPFVVTNEERQGTDNESIEWLIVSLSRLRNRNKKTLDGKKTSVR